MSLNFPLSVRPLKIINSILKYHGKSKGDINEKLEILDDPDCNLLIKQSDVILHCYNQNKFS